MFMQIFEILSPVLTELILDLDKCLAEAWAVLVKLMVIVDVWAIGKLSLLTIVIVYLSIFIVLLIGWVCGFIRDMLVWLLQGLLSGFWKLIASCLDYAVVTPLAILWCHRKTVKVDYEPTGYGQLKDYQIINGKIVLVVSVQGRLIHVPVTMSRLGLLPLLGERKEEAAMPNSEMQVSDLGKGAFLLYSGDQYIGVGSRFSVKGAIYVATAKHVGDKLNMFGKPRAQWRQHVIELPTLEKVMESVELDFVIFKDVLALRVLGGGVAVGKSFTRGMARITGSPDGKGTYVSVGVVGFGAHQLELLHGSSTMSGWSGAPIYNASGNVVGLHCGFDQNRGMNYGVPVVDILAHALIKNRASILGVHRESWDEDYEQADVKWGSNSGERPMSTSVKFYSFKGDRKTYDWTVMAGSEGVRWSDEEVDEIDWTELPKFQEDAVSGFIKGTASPSKKADRVIGSTGSSDQSSSYEKCASKDLGSHSAPPTSTVSKISDSTGLTRNQRRNLRRKLKKSRNAVEVSLNLLDGIKEPQEEELQICGREKESTISFQNSKISDGRSEPVRDCSDPLGTTVPCINGIPIVGDRPPHSEQQQSVKRSVSFGPASWRKPTPFEKLTFMTTGAHRVESWRPGQEDLFKVWQDRAVGYPERFEIAYGEKLAEVAALKRARRLENAFLNHASGFSQV